MAETPPNTPQRARAAARQNERTNRNMDTPQHRRTPGPAPPIAPLQFDIPIPPAPPVPANAPIPDDPFAPAPVQQYQHLPQHLAQQLLNLPPLAPAPGRGRVHGQGQGHLVAVSVNFCIYLYIFIDGCFCF